MGDRSSFPKVTQFFERPLTVPAPDIPDNLLRVFKQFLKTVSPQSISMKGATRLVNTVPVDLEEV